MDEAITAPDPAAGLAQRFEKQTDASRVAADVAVLASSPRGRSHHPEEMARAEEYVTARLREAGWEVTPAPFECRWVLGVSDAGGPGRLLGRLRLFPRRHGVNLLAELPAAAPGRRVLIVAHLDSVACSPGADDNASGVAALLECARLLASLASPPAVSLAVVDLEELGKLGSGALARNRNYVRDVEAVVCLESVGSFDDAPQSQSLGGLDVVFRDLARRVRANDSRGDFVLALCRRSSSAAARALVAAGGALSTPLPVLVARDPRPDGWRGRLMTFVFPVLTNLDRSDHAPFWNRGIPAILVTTTAPFRNRHYHLPGDRPETVDHSRVSALAAAVAATTATWFEP
jgi:hypothetical protein